MKCADIEKLHEAGLITADQRDKIIAHFRLKEEGGSKFLAIVSILGAVLITTGIILLVSAHWNGIPRGVKIAGGLALMLGAHAGGWWLREIQGQYRKLGEALHLVGSGLFLANIALLGQIYNLVSRPPNACLLWWVGIAALPWLLRSKAQHVLFLLAFGAWFGFEVNEHGWFYGGGDVRQILLYSLLGLIYLGAGWMLRGGAFAGFAGVTEKLGLLLFLIFFYPLTWKEFFGWDRSETQTWLLPALALVALLPLAAGFKHLRALDRQWRWSNTLNVIFLPVLRRVLLVRQFPRLHHFSLLAFGITVSRNSRFHASFYKNVVYFVFFRGHQFQVISRKCDDPENPA